MEIVGSLLPESRADRMKVPCRLAVEDGRGFVPAGLWDPLALKHIRHRASGARDPCYAPGNSIPVCKPLVQHGKYHNKMVCRMDYMGNTSTRSLWTWLDGQKHRRVSGS